MHILLSIPTLTAAIDVSILELALAFESRRPGTTLSVFTIHSVSPVELARNVIAQTVLAEPSITHVWMIDADIVVPPDAHTLLDIDADIVSARCPILIREQPDAPLRLMVPAGRKNPARANGFDMHFGAAREPVEVDACGTGCVLIRREVLQDPRMRLAPDVPGQPPALFRSVRQPNGVTIMGEDLDFTWRARQLGYRVVLESRVRCGHRKHVDLGDLERNSDPA
jgi:hypothetical protein